ncbi:MAG: 4Fe-4S binding protein, partial [Candidatus Atribacteria bacterium]|nr:4Fe-4S binding protein [Candidatus Atribacteria bacterium]
PELWLSVGIAVLLIILLGRFFCAWVCPASIVQTLKSNFHLKGFQTLKAKGNNFKSVGIYSDAESNNSTSLSKATEKGNAYSGLAVLVGALASSYLFGFPVFCLICPVGLTFGTIFAVMRWFSGAPPGLEMVVFPVMIIVELFMLKSWCRSLCPLGALLGLISRLNFFMRPKVQKEACLASRGVKCRICEKACPQEVALVKIGKDFNGEDCTKCLECYEKCPTKAIKLKLF